MSFKSFLSEVGHDAAKVFSFLGSAAGQKDIAAVEGATNAVVTAVNPVLGSALMGVEALINSGLRQAVSIEAVAAAAGAQEGSGPQKAAAFAASVGPQVGAFLQSIGVSNPTVTQVQQVSNALSTGIVAVLNSIPATAPAA